MRELGFEIGNPLWGKHFESQSLQTHLSQWWSEPDLIECVKREQRVLFFTEWAEHHEANTSLVCAKHPLLCLSGFDLEEAWGPNYKVIRAARPLEESIAGLTKRGWFDEPRRIQKTLHVASEKFFAVKSHFVSNYADLLADPQKQIGDLLEFLEIDRSGEQLIRAANLVRQHKSK
jgi:hypothetical protein